MPYYSDTWTDKELEALEKRIAEVYKQAEKDLDKEVKEYFAKFKLRDMEMQALVDAGEMTASDYQQWRMTQIARGQRYEALRDKVAERYTQANEVANAYVNDLTPSIYSLNRNYEAYQIEKAVGSCDFIMWDEDTVRRLIVEQPDIMPYYPPSRALARGIDLAYGKSQITKHVTSGIIRGLAPGKIANELMANVTTMNRNSAIRAARTGITAAQNAGRMDSYIAAEKMGIQIKRRWICTKDARTRFSHGMADGQIVIGTEKPFSVGGELMMFPGDQSMGAHGWNIYNCRCTTRTVEKDGIEAEPREMRVRNPETGEWELVNEMTYSDWLDWKKTGKKPVAKSGSGGIMNVGKSGVISTPQKTANQKYNDVLDNIQKRRIEYNPVEPHEKQLSESEIITAISGGDNTSGSCASVGIAYIGQKHGLNVLDYRGGKSMDYFSGKMAKVQMFEALGATPIAESSAKSDLTNGKRILSQMVKGKEYYLSVGRHAAIVRLNNDGLPQYLELQSATKSGWTDFHKDVRETLKWRFGCSSKSSYWNTAYLTDIDQFPDNDEFKTLLGFINTNESEQRKGKHGTIK